MFRAVFGNKKEGKGKDGGKKNQKNAGAKEQAHSSLQKGDDRRATHCKDRDRSHRERKLSRLTKGVSISLPSSPLLPRPADLALSQSCIRFPARVRKPDYADSSYSASCRGRADHRDIHVAPQLGSSLSSQELMTRLCFLLGEASPGSRSPMEDRRERKCDISMQGGSPSSTLTCSTASPVRRAPCAPHPLAPPSPHSSCSPCGTLSSPTSLAPSTALLAGNIPGPSAQSPTSTLESKDSGIIATITSSSENEERGADLPKDDGPGGGAGVMNHTAEERHSGSNKDNLAVLSDETFPRYEITESRTPPAPKRPLPQHHVHGTSSLVMQRPNSVAATSTTRLEDLSFLDHQRPSGHRASVRKHHTAGRTNDDSKGKLALFKQADIMLKPLLFEVPGMTGDTPFVGRDWLFVRLEEVLKKSSSCEGRGAVIVGNAGSGKTAIIWQLVNLSCHGLRTPQGSTGMPHSPGSSPKCGDKQSKSGSKPAAESQSNLSAGASEGKKEAVRALAAKVVAYHFCQADNTYTCLVPEFVHSLAALLARAPQLSSYRELLKGVLEPLSVLRKEKRLPEEDYIILVDSLNEAEFHKPDYGDTIAAFITKIISKFPHWLKLVVTVRTGLLKSPLSSLFRGISLDILPDSSDLGADLSDYIHHRVNSSSRVAANVTTATGTAPDPLLLSKFSSHLSSRSNGSVLYLQLTLDLFHKGHLAIKGGNYLVVPVSLSELHTICSIHHAVVISCQQLSRHRTTYRPSPVRVIYHMTYRLVCLLEPMANGGSASSTHVVVRLLFLREALVTWLDLDRFFKLQLCGCEKGQSIAWRSGRQLRCSTGFDTFREGHSDQYFCLSAASEW
ncbi:hypothetical protein WMY93_013388 [Mugilogobius chulae]|uniref:TANC1/2-like AAA+ ATPase lid domain-containing protein n=1 Tax=Mugilogobius chulae TaxID=88201 RepID=A0AAW0P9U9_9GOBI